MKKLILIPVLLLSFTIPGMCQQRIVEKHFQVKKKEKVMLHLKFGDKITVKSWPKNEVAFKANIEINQGKLNDALEFHYENRGGQLFISSDYNKEKIKTGRAADCSDSDYSSYHVSNDDVNVKYMVCAEITYKVFIPSHAELKIKTIDGDINVNNVAGRVHIKAISGDIKLRDLTGPVWAKSISGFVDLNWSAEKPAQFRLKTISGQVYTNLNGLNISNKGHHLIVGQNITAALGEGGPSVLLKSISGNIYLRK